MCESSPGYLDLCQAPQRSEVVRGDFGQRRCGGACVTYVHTCVYQMLAAPALDLRKKNCAHAQSLFELPIPIPIPSKFSEKRMTHSPIPISSGLRWGWVFLQRTRILSGIQFTTHFIEIFVVETKRFASSKNPNMLSCPGFMVLVT